MPALAVTFMESACMAVASPAHPRRLQYFIAGLAAALLAAFGFVADEVLEGDTVAFDTAVTAFFRDGDDPWGPMWLEEAMRDVTAMGSFTILGFVLIVAVLYLGLSGKARTAVFVGFAVIGGTIVSTGLKMVFDRPRPDVEAATRVFTASFPSGHATVSAVVYLTLGLLLAEAVPTRPLKIYFIGLGVFMTLAVGISRIYIGVHYPTDVIAGWSLGAAWALACWAGYSLLFGHDRGKTSG
jgi:undecaprenyl-diphosphatase